MPEWRGSTPQVVAAKASRYQYPRRCSNMRELCDALPAWEQLGSEMVLGLRDARLDQGGKTDKIVFQDLLTTIVRRPEPEVHAKLRCVKAKMEHIRRRSTS